MLSLYYFRFVIYITFIVVLFPSVVIHGDLTELSYDVLLALVIAIMMGVWISIRLTQGIGPAELTYWIFSYVFLGVAPIAQLSNELWPRPDNYTQYNIYLTLVYIFIANISFVLGFVIAKLSRKNKTYKEVMPGKEINKTILIILSTFALIISFYIFIEAGALDLIYVSRDERYIRITDLNPDSSYLGVFAYWLYRYPLLASFFLLALYVANNKKNALYYMLLFSLSIMLLIVSNPLTAERNWIGTVTLSAVFVFLPNYLKKIAPLIFISLVFIFLFAFSAMDMFRVEVSKERIQSEVGELSERVAFSGPDFDSFQQFINSVSYLQDGNNLIPTNASFLAFFWVPRTIWEGKPDNAGALISDYRGYENRNLSLPFVAEVYLMFGMVLMTVIMFIYGYFVQRIDDKYYSAQINNKQLTIVLVSLFSGYQVFLLRGPIFGVWPPIMMTMLWLFFHSSNIYKILRKL